MDVIEHLRVTHSDINEKKLFVKKGVLSVGPGYVLPYFQFV